jgi:hypothetical protein
MRLTNDLLQALRGSRRDVVRGAVLVASLAILLAAHASALPLGANTNFMTMFSDRTIITTQQLPVRPDQPAPFALLFRSAGHGAWTTNAPRTAEIIFVYMLNNEAGAYFGTVAVRGNLTLSDNGQSFRGAVTGTFTDPTGKESAMETNTVTAERIVVDYADLPKGQIRNSFVGSWAVTFTRAG